MNKQLHPLTEKIRFYLGPSPKELEEADLFVRRWLEDKALESVAKERDDQMDKLREENERLRKQNNKKERIIRDLYVKLEAKNVNK